MGDSAHRAQVRPDQHPRRKGVRFRADELDPERLGERQGIGVDAVD
jgi:hypothetical protein